MGKKLWIAAAVLSAAAYSYLPSQMGKLNHRMKSRKRGKKAYGSETDKVLYLTFDDGPHPVYTAQLLDLLAEYNIKATFFVVGKFAEENPDLVHRMKREGHSVGLHSYGHKSAMLQTKSAAQSDMKKALQTMKDLGISTNLYRPPWGQVNWFTLREFQIHAMKRVLWDVMADDWKENTDETEIQYKLLKKAKSGSVICLHDRQADGKAGKLQAEIYSESLQKNGDVQPPQNMIAALRKTLPLWMEEGYRFDIIG